MPTNMKHALPVVKRDTWCRHRTAFSSEFKTCKVGVDFHKFDRAHDRMPCLGETEEARASCDKYSGYTAEEIAAHEAALDARLKQIFTIRPAIVAHVKLTGNCAGDIPCPACKTGIVRYSQASNGHIHAKCSTLTCASWME